MSPCLGTAPCGSPGGPRRWRSPPGHRGVVAFGGVTVATVLWWVLVLSLLLGLFLPHCEVGGGDSPQKPPGHPGRGGPGHCHLPKVTLGGATKVGSLGSLVLGLFLPHCEVRGGDNAHPHLVTVALVVTRGWSLTCRAPVRPPRPSSRWQSPSGARRVTCGRPPCAPRSAPRWAAPA